MKKLIGYLLMGLALVAAIVYGFVITENRNALNIELQSTKSELSSMQAELNTTKLTLISTESELTSTKQTLSSTQTRLSSTKQTLVSTQSELTSTNQKLSSTQTRLSSTKQTLTSTQSELSSTNQKLSSVQNDLLANKTKMDAIDAKLKLYEDTMGIKIFSGVQPLARGAGPIELINNSAATNPSWQQLMSFLRVDPTDERTWTEGIFVSGDFANVLHNNAEALGIKAALVGLFFEGKTIGHGLNAFKTTDRGLVYVETQSDGIAYVTKGREYGIMSSGQNTPLDYAYYEKVKADWDSYYQRLEAYNREVERFNGEIFGKVYYIGTTEWELIKQWHNTLEAEARVLDSLRVQLPQVGEPMGIVESIQIYW